MKKLPEKVRQAWSVQLVKVLRRNRAIPSANNVKTPSRNHPRVVYPIVGFGIHAFVIRLLANELLRGQNVFSDFDLIERGFERIDLLFVIVTEFEPED